jgi:hypothetical protein
MLRYRDTALDSGTKDRYHAKLQALKDIALPSAAEEARDEAAAFSGAFFVIHFFGI